MHRWLVDPQDRETSRVVQKYSDYDSLVDFSVQFESSRAKGKSVDRLPPPAPDTPVVDSDDPAAAVGLDNDVDEDLLHDSLVFHMSVSSLTACRARRLPPAF